MLTVTLKNLWKIIKNVLTQSNNSHKMTVLKKLQKQLSMIRNLHVDATMQGNITNIISNVLFVGILLSYVITTTWYFCFINRAENYLKYVESWYFVVTSTASLIMYLEIYRTRNGYNKFFEKLDFMVKTSTYQWKWTKRQRIISL